MKMPKHLEPNPNLDVVDETQVAIEEAPERALTTENVNHAFELLGFGNLTSDKSMALRELGIDAKHQGVLTRMHGTVLIGQQGFAELSAKIHQALNKGEITPEELKDLGKTWGYLWGQIAKLNSSTLKGEAVVVQAANEADKQRRASFQPRQVIVVNSEKT